MFRKLANGPNLISLNWEGCGDVSPSFICICNCVSFLVLLTLSTMVMMILDKECYSSVRLRESRLYIQHPLEGPNKPPKGGFMKTLGYFLTRL